MCEHAVLESSVLVSTEIIELVDEMWSLTSLAADIAADIVSGCALARDGRRKLRHENSPLGARRARLGGIAGKLLDGGLRGDGSIGEGVNVVLPCAGGDATGEGGSNTLTLAGVE